MTRHRWLEQPTTVSNPAVIVTALDRLWYLNGLGVSSWDVSGLHSDRQKRLVLPAGLPAVDTYRRVFGKVDVTRFNTCFMA